MKENTVSSEKEDVVELNENNKLNENNEVNENTQNKEDNKDKEKAVGTIGDQRIGQDSVGTSAAPAPDPGDPDSLTDRAAVEKIKDITLITGEAGTTAPAPAVGAGLLLRPESLLLALIEAGCRTFYTN